MTGRDRTLRVVDNERPLCQNFWWRMPDDSRFELESLVRSNCERPATQTVHSTHFGVDMRLCDTCAKDIELQNYLRTPEGEAAIRKEINEAAARHKNKNANG